MSDSNVGDEAAELARSAPQIDNRPMRRPLHWSVSIGSIGVLAAAIGTGLACGSSGSEFPNSGAEPDSGTTSGSSGFPIGTDNDADGVTPVATDVEAVLTSDNAFSFGYGDGNALGTFIRGEGSDSEGIFNCPVGLGPVAFKVPKEQAPAGAYLYVIAWADENVTQGTLAQFKRVGGKAIYSGDGAWEVCATGKPFNHLEGGPDQTTVNTNVGECNKGAAGETYSKGWVNTAGAVTAGAKGKLAFGEANDSSSTADGGVFPIVCQKDDAGVDGIDAVARWMWFDPLDGKSPFSGNEGHRTKEFLIFRLPASALPASVN